MMGGMPAVGVGDAAPKAAGNCGGATGVVGCSGRVAQAGFGAGVASSVQRRSKLVPSTLRHISAATTRPAYLTETLETSDPDFFADVLRVITRACGMGQTASGTTWRSTC